MKQLIANLKAACTVEVWYHRITGIYQSSLRKNITWRTIHSDVGIGRKIVVTNGG